jgi:hypothetical protein
MLKPLPKECKKENNFVRTNVHIWVRRRWGVLVVWEMITEGDPCLPYALPACYLPPRNVWNVVRSTPLHAVCRPAGWSHSLATKPVPSPLPESASPASFSLHCLSIVNYFFIDRAHQCNTIQYNTTGAWGKLRNYELDNCNSSRNIIRMIMSRRMKWAGPLAPWERGETSIKICCNA